MQKHNLKRKTKRAKHVQIGRGGKRGKTSGRGTKGQKARAGHRIRPEIRDMIKKLPKLRGRGKNINTSRQISNFSVKLSDLVSNFKSGDNVTLQNLFEKKIIRKINGKFPPVKIVGSEKIDVKLIINKISVSESAKKSITDAGGEIN